MLYMITKNLKNWDFYCINFLISDMKLRSTLNSLASKNKKGEKQNGFFLSEIDSNYKPLFSNLEKHKFSDNENKLSILFTNENRQNYINTFLPYRVIISHKKILKNKDGFIFNFNFFEMIKLIKIYLKWNLIKFLKKFLLIDIKNQTIDIDRCYLKIFDENFLNYIIDYEVSIEPEKQFIELEILYLI